MEKCARKVLNAGVGARGDGGYYGVHAGGEGAGCGVKVAEG